MALMFAFVMRDLKALSGGAALCSKGRTPAAPASNSRRVIIAMISPEPPAKHDIC
jgi:hypothetical protein